MSIKNSSFQKTFKTYATYVFGSLNLFNMETRNLVYSRPFFVTYQGEDRLSAEKMIEYGMKRFCKKLADPSDKFTAKMIEDLQDYFGEVGEQKDAIRTISGTLKDTCGVLPVCDNCVRTTEDDLPDSSKERLRTFARYFFNVKMSQFKQVVPLPENQQKVQDSVHTFTIKTKEGDVRFSQSSYAGYDESGQTLLAVNVPEPKNKVKLALRYVVATKNISENAFGKQYNTILDICFVREETGAKDICALPNIFEKTVTGSRKTSDVYYFSTEVNYLLFGAVDLLKEDVASMDNGKYYKTKVGLTLRFFSVSSDDQVSFGRDVYGVGENDKASILDAMGNCAKAITEKAGAHRVIENWETKLQEGFEFSLMFCSFNNPAWIRQLRRALKDKGDFVSKSRGDNVTEIYRLKGEWTRIVAFDCKRRKNHRTNLKTQLVER